MNEPEILLTKFYLNIDKNQMEFIKLNPKIWKLKKTDPPMPSVLLIFTFKMNR